MKLSQKITIISWVFIGVGFSLMQFFSDIEILYRNGILILGVAAGMNLTLVLMNLKMKKECKVET